MTIIESAARQQKFFTTNMKENYGYETISTFWSDFSIAEAFSLDAVQETGNRCFKEWKWDYKMLTELSMVLNHKMFYHRKNNNLELANVYKELWTTVDEYAVKNLKGEEASYYYETTD